MKFPEEPKPKTIMESFVEGLHNTPYERSTRFTKILDAFFAKVLEGAGSYDEWHEYLSGHGIILVKSRNSREMYKERWHSWAAGRFSILKNPAERDGCEMMLVPYSTIDKMILLGMLPETSSS